MAVNTQEFKIKLSVDDGASGPLKALKSGAADSASALEKFGLSTIALNQALELGKKAMELFLEPLKEAVKAYAEYEQASNKVGAALKISGQYSKEHVAIFQEFAEQMEKTSNVSEDVTLQLVAMGKASGFSDSQTKEMIQTSAGLAKLLDGDVNGAFRELMATYSGMAGRLDKIDPQIKNFTEGQNRAGASAKYLADKVRGLAESDVSTLGGSFTAVELALKNFQRQIGETISKTIDLPKLVQTIKDALNFLKDKFVELSPKIVAFGQVIKDIDWKKIAEGILAVAAAFAIWKAAMFTGELLSAVAAIGGLQAAISAMGGMGGIISQLGTFFKTLAAEGLAAVAPMLSVAAAIAGIAIAAIAIDILLRNTDKLGQLWTLVAESVKIALYSILQAINFVISETFAAIAYMGEKINSFFGKNIVNVESFNKQIEAGYKNANDLSDAADKSKGKITEAAKGVDFGAAGEIVKFVTNGLKALTGETDKAAKSAKTHADNADQVIPPLQEQLKLLKEINQQNASLQNDIKNIGVSQIEQIGNNLGLQNKLLEAKRAQLEVEGKIGANSGAQGQAIEDALNQQKALNEEKAKAQIEQIRNPNAVGADNVQAIKEAMGEGSAEIANSIGKAAGSMSGAMSGVGATMSAVTGVLDFVQQLIDFIPQVLDKITNIFNSLTDLPNKIATGIANLMKSVVNFVANFIPNLLRSIPDILKTLVDGLFKQIPAAIEQLLMSLPDIINGILDQLPDIIQDVVVGLITEAPRIMMAMVEFLIRGAPRIAIEMIKVFYIELPKAIIKGLIEGGKELIGMLTDFFSGKQIKLPSTITDLPKNIEKAVSNLGANIAKETSQIFQVKDLTNALKGTDSIQTSAQAAMDMMDDEFLKLWEMLKKAWQWVYDHIIGPFINAITEVWQWVYDTILQPILDGLTAVWQNVYDNILRPFLDLTRGVWQTIWNNFMQPFAGVINAAWQVVYNFFNNIFQGRISDAFKGVIADLSSLGDKIASAFALAIQGYADVFRKVGGFIWDGLNAGLAGASKTFNNLGDAIWQGLKSGVNGLGDIIKNQLNAINPANLLQKMFHFDGGGTGPVEKVLGIDVPYVSFAQGGYVPGQSEVPGDSAVNDRIVALVSPGEAIIKRSITQNPVLKPIVDALMLGDVKKVLASFWSGSVGPISVSTDNGGSISVGGNSVSAGGIATAASTAAKSVGGTVGSAFNGGINALKTGGGNVLDGMTPNAQTAWAYAQQAASGVGKAASDAWKQLQMLNPENLWEIAKRKAWEGVSNMIEGTPQRFHNGGWVPAYAGGGEVPLIAEPGEHITNRRAAYNNSGLLNAINSGAPVSTGTTINVDKIEINAKTNLDADAIRREVVPQLMQSIKRSSQDGVPIISKKGIF